MRRRGHLPSRHRRELCVFEDFLQVKCSATARSDAFNRAPSAFEVAASVERRTGSLLGRCRCSHFRKRYLATGWAERLTAAFHLNLPWQRSTHCGHSGQMPRLSRGFMTGFEFAFSLFGLLLGLCIAEVLGGLGRALEHREEVSIGWLTPMLGTFVLLDLTTYWFALWIDRENIPITPITLLLGTTFAAAYYLAAYLIFPDDLKRHTDLDAHFMRVRRIVLGIQLTVFAIQGVLQSYGTTGLSLRSAGLTLAIFAPFYGLAMFAKRKVVIGLGLALIIVLNLFGMVQATSLSGQ